MNTITVHLFLQHLAEYNYTPCFATIAFDTEGNHPTTYTGSHPGTFGQLPLVTLALDPDQY